MSVPVLLVTGFLGAGKTTFINQLLQAEHGLRIAAIVNDFGSINIDAALLDAAADGVIGLKNGCICCSLQGDLLRTLKIVLGQDPQPELIVIEASGVADPAGVIQSLIDPVLWDQARLETVVCVIDAPDVPDRSGDPLWRAQVRESDFLCLAKTEGLSADALAAIHAGFAVQSKYHVFDLALPVPISAFVGRDTPVARDSTRAPLQDDRFAYLEWRHDGAIELQGFQAVMSQLAPSLLRAKGFLSFEQHQSRMLFQLTGTRATLARAPKTDDDGCQLVLIGDRKVFDASHAAAALDALTHR